MLQLLFSRSAHKSMFRLILLLACSLLFAGCKESFMPRFSLTEEVYDTEQYLTIEVDAETTNLYLTTDGTDPVVDPLCAYNGEAIVVDRPTRVKLRYEQLGEVFTIERTFFVKQNLVDSGYTNRRIIEVWERFFVDHVLNAFDPPDNQDSFFSLVEDGGSQVVLETNILSRTPFTKVPTSGEQSYRFQFFERENADTGDVVRINSGAIYGYRNEDGGHYTTYTTKRTEYGEPMASRLYFAGTYNGWADGQFWMNADGVTTGGYYEVDCVGLNCAPSPVQYHMLEGSNTLVEVGPARHQHTRSCTPPPEDGEVIDG